jgi:hypothetical protein
MSEQNQTRQLGQKQFQKILTRMARKAALKRIVNNSQKSPRPALK